LGESTSDFIRCTKGRADYQDFFRGPTRFQPILATRDAVMTGSGCGNPDAHILSLRMGPSQHKLSKKMEAPIVVYSMTTPSYLDAPRGMEFLYSLNRLNVATSRARAICVIIGSPAIFEAECRTPRQMQLANAFCRYLEMAVTI
jgi:hypothetical protein